MCEWHCVTAVIYSSACFKRPSGQVTWKSLLTGGCLLLNESNADILYYFHAAISNHLSEKPKLSLVVYDRLTLGLTVNTMIVSQAVLRVICPYRRLNLATYIKY